MRTNPFLPGLILAGSLLAACGGEAEGPPVPASTWADDEAEIRSRIEASVEAFNRGDLPGHLAIYDPAVTFMTSGGPRPGVAPIEASFREAFFVDGLPKQRLGINEIAARRLGSDFALLTGRYVLAGGDAAEQTGWFTLVWQRTPAGWRAIHDHSS